MTKRKRTKRQTTIYNTYIQNYNIKDREKRTPLKIEGEFRLKTGWEKCIALHLKADIIAEIVVWLTARYTEINNDNYIENLKWLIESLNTLQLINSLFSINFFNIVLTKTACIWPISSTTIQHCEIH